MTIKELKKMIEVAEQLNQGDAIVCINDSRDGVKSYPAATAEFITIGSQHDRSVVLAISYK